MKTTLEELRDNNIGYALGKDGITEVDLRLVNGIIDKIEQTRTRKPQPLDVVEYTDSFGCYYPNAMIDGDFYRNGSTALCECGSAYVSVSDDGSLCKSISGGAFPLIDKDKLHYLGRKEITVLEETGNNEYLVDYRGVKCSAIFNTANFQYYADDVYGRKKE